jgi:phage terminase large subunit
MSKSRFEDWGGEILYPRSYQKPLIAAIRNKKYDRACCVWHRRAGKDLTVLANIMIPEACEVMGNYYYYFPTLRLGKKVVWEGKTADERRFLDFFPRGSIKSVNVSELKVTLFNNSIIQIIGLDNPDLAVRGTGMKGAVFSEYAEQPKMGWEVVEPAVVESGGWAVFIYTPKGANHGQELFEMASKNSDWFCQHLNIEQTKKDAPGENGEPIYTIEKIDKMRAEGREEAFLQQEYYCSFTGIMVGTIYGDLMTRMREDNRISRFPHLESHRVYTAWDIGLRDDTAVIFFQYIQNEIRIIDFLKASGRGLNWFLTELEVGHRRNYLYEEHYAPWDFEHGHFAADGKSCVDLARSKGFRFRVVPKAKVQNGIEAVRQTLPRTCIDVKNCHDLIVALESYHRDFNNKTGTYNKEPKHDKHSHACDAMRTLAQGFVPPRPKDLKRPTRAITDFDPGSYGKSQQRRGVKVKTGWSPTRRWR